MKLTVIKTGYMSFDVLHAVGLAVLLAEACDATVHLQDSGMHYQLTVPDDKPLPQVDSSVVETILAIPTLDEIANVKEEDYQDVRFRNLDGLLAVASSRPGPRAISLPDLAKRNYLSEKEKAKWYSMARQKVERIIFVLHRGFEKETQSSTEEFLHQVCSEYLAGSAKIPLVGKFSKNGKRISIWVTIEPSLGYSTRSPTSDYRLELFNTAVSGTRFATFLAVIGAARLLRAQKIKSSQMMYWLPTIGKTSIVPNFSLPPLHFLDGNIGKAILVHALDVLRDDGLDSIFNGLIYRDFLLQGVSQSIPLKEGMINISHLDKLPSRLIRMWARACFSEPGFDADLLSGALFDKNFVLWEEFLVTWYELWFGKHVKQQYTFGEVMEVNSMLDPKREQPLSVIMNEKAGARKFGALLRQLNLSNRGEYLEVYAALMESTTAGDVLSALSDAMNEIAAMRGRRSKFRVIPTNKDVEKLVEQMDDFGVRDVKQILMILGSLYVPKETENIK